MNHLPFISFSVLIAGLAVPCESHAGAKTAPPTSAPAEASLGGLTSAYESAPKTEVNDEGMAIAGVVLTSIGVIGGVAGVVSLAALDGASAAYAGMFILAPAGTFLAVGIPLLVVGAVQVPRESGVSASDLGSIRLQVSPGGLALVGSF